MEPIQRIVTQSRLDAFEALKQVELISEEYGIQILQ
jgi:hypothetical protein